MSDIKDVIIIGGGPAEMTAALYCVRNGKSVLIIEKQGFGGQITYSPRVENYPGFLQMSGNEFADKMMDQLMAHGVDMEFSEVIQLTNEACKKKVYTDDGNCYEAKTVILATGVKHRLLGVDGEEDMIGNGISFCALCDGDFYANQTVAVVGGGNSALQEAILLAEKCKSVIMIQDLPYFTGDRILLDTLMKKSNVSSYTGVKVDSLIIEGGQLRGIRIRKTAAGEDVKIHCSGLFVAVGLVPENECFSNLADLDSFGYFDSNESCLTKTPGVFCAGDCRKKSVRQLTTAVSDGACAAVAACSYIDEKEN